MSGAVDRADLSVLHIGAGRYRPDETTHATFAIWRELAKGFRRYTVVGRSTDGAAHAFHAAGVDVRLLSSRFATEVEFLVTQHHAVAIADDVGADVVVAQCPVQGGLAAARIRKRRNSKSLVEFHMAHYFQPKPMVSRAWVLEALTRLSLPHADRIRVLTQGMCAGLGARYGAAYQDRATVLPPRVDLTQFSTLKTKWQADGRFKVILVGSVTPRKGQRLALEALLPMRPEIEIWIVGDGEDRSPCEAVVAAHRATDRVRFFGNVTHATLADLLPQADAFLLFSAMEGAPRALMEAMAVGLPVITTDAGYCADVVEDGKSGLVLEGREAKALQGAVERLRTDEGFREHLGQAARARAVADYEAQSHYERYRRLIRDTANG